MPKIFAIKKSVHCRKTGGRKIIICRTCQMISSITVTRNYFKDLYEAKREIQFIYFITKILKMIFTIKVYLYLNCVRYNIFYPFQNF